MGQLLPSRMVGTSVRIGVSLYLLSLSCFADEGMWLFNNPPAKQLKERYGFEIKQEWLDHLQRSSVHFGGGSGSFVSNEGLVLTNHHVGAGTLEKLSTAEHDYLKDGFHARTLEEELRCPDLELRVLMRIEDVTAKVNAAVAGDHTPEEAAAARREVMARIERESQETTGMRSDVVTLYRGGAYHLYLYKTYRDVRLVFAPEKQAGAFGGDPDNFEFPRYCLDLAFFRVYEDGKPAQTPDYLKWSSTGAKDGELTFVSGHPGRTNRADTYAELVDDRDRALPERLDYLLRNETLLSNWAARDEENHRRASGAITGLQNGRKAAQAKIEGLLDPEFMANKAATQKALHEAFLKNGKKEAAEAFDVIAKIQKSLEPTAKRQHMLEGAGAFNTSLFSIARTLVRAADETPKDDGDRLREFRTSARPQLELSLFSPRPIYKDLETEKLGASLTFLCGALGAEDPLVVKILNGKPPYERAAQLIAETRVNELDVRHQLYDGGKEAIANTKDPMIALAKLIDAESRELRKQSEAAGEVITKANQQIALARFAIEGESTYPDATGTLRLSYGEAKGYESRDGKVPWATPLGGLEERSLAKGGQGPYEMPINWKGKEYNKDAFFNFISTADIIGGNSGSPVVNTKGELVGLIFDGNASSLILDYGYSDKSARAVSVHSAGMLEALKNIYQADRLVKEITR